MKFKWLGIWNGPEDFQPQATEIIDEVLEPKEYFKHIKTGMRFFASSFAQGPS